MSKWQDVNAEIVRGLRAAVHEYPQTIPPPVHQAVLDATGAYAAGDRDPELLFFLVTMYAMRNDNVIRYRLHQSGLQQANEFAT